MSTEEFWDEALPQQMLASPLAPLTPEQIESLWEIFCAIPDHWGIKYDVILIRSRWLDMLEARCSGEPNYLPEYAHASQVFDALFAKLGDKKQAAFRIYGTLVTDRVQADTRMKHAKFYVVNDFIRCFIASGGFRAFVANARNHAGFMGGSRFREWPPVRTGRRL
jgi:hypothetical protein